MKRKQWPDRPGLFTRDKNWKITWLNPKCYMTLTDLQERKFAHIVTKWQCNVKHMKWCHFWLWIKGWSHCLWNVCLSSLNRRGPVLGTPDVTLGLSAIVNRRNPNILSRPWPRTSRGSKWVCLIGRSREVYIRCWGQSTHSCCWGQGTDTSQKFGIRHLLVEIGPQFKHRISVHLLNLPTLHLVIFRLKNGL